MTEMMQNILFRGKDWMGNWIVGDLRIEPSGECFILSRYNNASIKIDEPELNRQGLGCGLEDSQITNRYEAAEYGWNRAIERCADHFPDWMPVISETVGIFTGLYDNTSWDDAYDHQKDYAYEISLCKNFNKDNPEDNWKGVMIFEGDWVEIKGGDDLESGFYRTNLGEFFLKHNLGWVSAHIGSVSSGANEFFVEMSAFKKDGSQLTNDDITEGQDGIWSSCDRVLMLMQYLSNNKHCRIINEQNMINNYLG